MVSLSELKSLERVDEVPPADQTEGKDDAADAIEELMKNEADWPMTMTEIGQRTGWTRQHVSNTIQDYFSWPGKHDEFKGRNVEIPADVEKPADYLRGLSDGWRLASEE